ncbi:MAG: hypothetical protein HYY24_27265 [Verrucomicrobia bacterium]|nr:hypothetical protein [Verrucomicrobiota bacterium]
MKNCWVYSFDDPLPAGVDAPERLGGKGAGLAALRRAGLPVPPGFTITTEACRYFFAHDQTWPPELETELRHHLQRLEQATGRSFGQGLLVAVRSGAAVSMPGMMDTLLNCGLHPGQAAEFGEAPPFWQAYVAFIIHFAATVAHLPPEVFSGSASGLRAPASRATAERCLALYERKGGKPFPTDPWQLLVECINAVFRSWNSERAIAYRKRNHIRALLGTAVNIQAMFPSRVSGILFTQDPNHLSARQMVIESSYGLGEAVVSGEVTPDRFLVKRDDLADLQSFLAPKTHWIAALGDRGEYDANAPSLQAQQIAELCQMALGVESHFSQPMDIEWGWADGRFALLQCRSIRGFDVAQDAEAAREEAIQHLRALAGAQRRVWVLHNLDETLRFPTPLTWDIIKRFMNVSGGFGLMYRDFGYRPAKEVCEHGFLELICGRIFADPERMAQLFWGGLPMRYSLDAILKDKNALNRAPTEFEPERVDGLFLWRLPALVWSMVRCWRRMKQLRSRAKTHFESVILPPYLTYVREKRPQDLSALSTTALLAELRDRCARVLDDFGKESLKPGFFGALALTALEGRLVQLLGRAEAARLTKAFVSGLEDTTYQQDALLYQLAHQQSRAGGMREFLEKFGHRATGEMELAEPRWREDPSYLDQVADQIQSGSGRLLEDIHAANLEKRRAAAQELSTLLAQSGGSSFREEIEAQLRETQALLPYRENGKHFLMMGYELIRLAILELGRRWHLERDIFFLQAAELEQWEQQRGQLLPEIERRKLRWKSVQRLDLPEVIDSEQLAHLGQPPQCDAAEGWRGQPVSPGQATGHAQVVLNPRETGKLGNDYILVCPSTDPGWTPLFIRARGLIVERGGLLSHGAIVARDFGIPAVVCPQATRLINSGDRLRLDGNTGEISKISEKPHA